MLVNKFHLTYCTNIHPGNGWNEVFANLQKFVPTVKSRFAPSSPFGIGLRLSHQESIELLEGGNLEDFKHFLNKEGLYIFTMNGFPYGAFHGVAVKEKVFGPDWQTEERANYTIRLARILAELLPKGTEGSISTSPLSYKMWIDHNDTTAWKKMTQQVIHVVEELVRLRNESGCLIHLDFEPEPDGLIENSSEVIKFFESWLLKDGSRALAEKLGISDDDARVLVLEHVRMCYDTCHMSAGYEDLETVLDKFAPLGIKIGKVQISSALKVVFPADVTARKNLLNDLAKEFTEPVYLHQVFEKKSDGSIMRYTDLDKALLSGGGPDVREWRIHFHMPLFVDKYGAFNSTQDEVKRVIAILRKKDVTTHLEVETYTWSVLPPELKADLTDSIIEELTWVYDQIT